jgi:hypothetical protein
MTKEFGFDAQHGQAIMFSKAFILAPKSEPISPLMGVWGLLVVPPYKVYIRVKNSSDQRNFTLEILPLFICIIS